MSDFEGHARITREAVRRRRGGSASGDRSGLARLPFLVPLRDVADVICSSGSCAEHHFMRHGPSEDPRRAFADSVAFIGECARRAEGGRDLWALAGAAHCLQDSFSGGHVLREGLGPGRPGTILHVKVYRGLERRGHAELDRGWSDGDGGFSTPGELAVAATGELLAVILDEGGHGWAGFAAEWLAPAPDLGEHGDWRALDLIEKHMDRLELLFSDPGLFDEEGMAADLARLLESDPPLACRVLAKLDELSPRNAAQTAALIQFLWRNSPRSSGPGSRRGRRDLGELQARGR